MRYEKVQGKCEWGKGECMHNKGEWWEGLPKPVEHGLERENTTIADADSYVVSVNTQREREENRQRGG